MQQDPRTATIRLRTRKNSANGADIMRKCVCASQGKILCAVCYLHTQAAWHKRYKRHLADALFQVDLKEALAYLRASTGACEETRPTWHAFRRGYATDLLASLHDWGGGGSHASGRVVIKRLPRLH